MPDAETADAVSGPVTAWHQVLLRMAGAVPDDLISEARAWLGDGQSVDVAQTLVFAAAAGQVPVLAQDAALMSQELRRAGQDTDVIHELNVVDENAVLPDPWLFSPVWLENAAAATLAPALLDLTTDPTGFAELDQIDQAMVAAVQNEATQNEATQNPIAVTAVWRAWRLPADGSPWPQPRRVFVVSTPDSDQDADLPGLTARLQEELIAAGEDDPQVEVCQEGAAVPAYQSKAWAYSALLWAQEPATPIQLARVFDAVDPQDGPSFDPDHPTLDDLDEVDRLLDYLDGGLPVLIVTATMADVVDPEHPVIVPLTFRSDGEWIWTDSVAYYLEQYSIAPEEGLLAHLRAAVGLPPPLSEVAVHRVLAFLEDQGDAEPVWVVPEMSAGT